MLLHLLHEGHLLLFLQVFIYDGHIGEHQLLSFLNLLLHQHLKLLFGCSSYFLVVHIDAKLLHWCGSVVSWWWNNFRFNRLKDVRLVVQELSFGFLWRCTLQLPLISLLLLYIADSLVRVSAEVKVRARLKSQTLLLFGSSLDIVYLIRYGADSTLTTSSRSNWVTKACIAGLIEIADVRAALDPISLLRACQAHSLISDMVYKCWVSLLLKIAFGHRWNDRCAISLLNGLEAIYLTIFEDGSELCCVRLYGLIIISITWNNCWLQCLDNDFSALTDIFVA